MTNEQIGFIRRLIQDRPGWSRWKLSRELCQAWQWRQANGALRDMVCRGLLLMLHRSGEIELPPIKRAVRNRIAERARPAPVFVEQRLVQSSLGDLQPLEFVQVRRTPEEALFNSLLDQHHYLGYERPVGEHLKYLVKARAQVIACLAWSSAPRHLKLRDHYLGWSNEARERNVHLLVYNTRFLIRGSRYHTWPRTFWAAWPRSFPAIGSAFTPIRFIGWKRSWIHHASRGRVTAPPTGARSETPWGVGIVLLRSSQRGQ